MTKVYDASAPPESGNRATSVQAVALLIRCNDSFLFASEGEAGAAPFLRDLNTTQPLPPTLASEGLIVVVDGLAAEIGLQPREILTYEILSPSDTLRPFRNVTIHSVILDVSEATFQRMRSASPGRVVLSAPSIMSNLADNVFFRSISESYRVATPVPA